MTAFLPFGISPGTSYEVDARVLMADFGDGYVGRAGDGINTMGKKYDVKFDALTKAEKDYVVGFFATHKGYVAFDWTPPGATVAIKWIARRWKVTNLTREVSDVSAQFEQVFDN